MARFIRKNIVSEVCIVLGRPVTILPSQHEPHAVLKRHGTCCFIPCSSWPAKHTSYPKRRVKYPLLLPMGIQDKIKPLTSRLLVVKVAEYCACGMTTVRPVAGLEITDSMSYGHPMLIEDFAYISKSFRYSILMMRRVMTVGLLVWKATVWADFHPSSTGSPPVGVLLQTEPMHPRQMDSFDNQHFQISYIGYYEDNRRPSIMMGPNIDLSLLYSWCFNLSKSSWPRMRIPSYTHSSPSQPYLDICNVAFYLIHSLLRL